jgi:HD-like signal output (HDOD) protein
MKVVGAYLGLILGGVPMADRSSLEALLNDASRIPAAPGVAMELARLSREESSSIDHLVAILKCDPTLAAKILRMANSAYFASRREIVSLADAVIRLGLRRVQIMALAFCIMAETSGKIGSKHVFSYSYFWNHSLITSNCCEALAASRRLCFGLEASVAGLLQDIGVLIIQTAMPEKYRGVITYQNKSDEELYVTETRRLGFNHMQAGELLLRRWNIPEVICAAIGNHHQPEALQGGDPGAYELAKACQVGAAVAKFLGNDQHRPSLLARAMKAAEDNFGIGAAEFQTLLSTVRMKLDASAEVFEVKLDETIIRRLDAAIRDEIADNVLHFPEASESER